MHERPRWLLDRRTRPLQDRENIVKPGQVTWKPTQLIDWFRFVVVPIIGFILTAVIGPLVIAYAKKCWPDLFQ